MCSRKTLALSRNYWGNKRNQHHKQSQWSAERERTLQQAHSQKHAMINRNNKTKYSKNFEKKRRQTCLPITDYFKTVRATFFLPRVAAPVHCIDLGQVAPESASRPHLYPAHWVQTSCDLPKHRKKCQRWHYKHILALQTHTTVDSRRRKPNNRTSRSTAELRLRGPTAHVFDATSV